MTRVRRATGIVAALAFAATAVRAFVRMGPVPTTGMCGMSPTCPNTHQWVALLVVAVVCGLLALMIPGLLWSESTRRRRWWSGPAIALVLAAALLIVDPPGHLNSLHATWFGHPFSDSRI